MGKGLKPKEYKRFTPAPIETDSTLDVVLSMAVDSLKSGRPAAYPETEQGFEDFKAAVIDYFVFVKRSNEDSEHDKKLIADIEGLCTFIGITRVTLLSYEKNRGEEWQTFIKQAKTAIVAIKKQLIFNQQIPPIIGIFDLVNNTDYYRNSSEFKLTAEAKEPERKVLRADELPIFLGDPSEREAWERERAKENKALLPELTDNKNESEV